jgi:hypothetical protein
MARDVAQVDGPSGLRYGGNTPGRVFDMTSADAAAAVKAGGAYASVTGTTRRSLGYRCGGCGFGTYTVRCSRCGGACEREKAGTR